MAPVIILMDGYKLNPFGDSLKTENSMFHFSIAINATEMLPHWDARHNDVHMAHNSTDSTHTHNICCQMENWNHPFIQ